MSSSVRGRAATVLLLVVTLLVPLSLRSGERADAAVAGDTKLACAYTGNDVSQLQQFGWLVGRTMDCASLFNDTASSWAAWSDPWFAHMPLDQPQYDWKGWLAGGNRTIAITQSLVPTGVDPSWRSLGASGAYDAYIQTLATNLVGYGMGNAIIRLAPEANGDWKPDQIGSSAQDYAAWAAYWAHFVTVMRSVPGTHFQFDWTINPGYRAVPFSSYYPGDGVVDIIGIDQYDYASSWVGSAQPARWQYQQTLPLGLNDLVSFATAHGKPLSLPEWGVVPTTDQGGIGDDAYYADQIGSLVKNNVVRYESYFNVTTGNTMRLQDVPGARAAWKRHFGAAGDAVGVTPAPPIQPAPTYPSVPAALDTKKACLDESNSLAALQNFGWLIGRTMDCAVIHNDSSSSWTAWTDPWVTRTPPTTTDTAWATWVAGSARTVVLAQSLVPAGLPSTWRQQGAAGAYDGYVTTLAKNLVARGFGSAIVRLGGKANADGIDSFGTTAADNAAWVAYWQRFVTVMAAVPGANFQFEWTVNAGYHAVPLDSYYPGDGYVDVVGIAQYDAAPSAIGTAQPARWNYETTLASGLNAVVAFARTHGKPIAISEWAGIVSTRADGGGDDAYFADQVATLVRTVPTRYQAYVNATSNGNLRLQDGPGMRASWKRHFGAAGDSLHS